MPLCVRNQDVTFNVRAVSDHNQRESALFSGDTESERFDHTYS